MLKYLVKRLLKAAVTIFFILTLVFFFTRLSGDPTDWILPDDATEEQRIEMRLRRYLFIRLLLLSMAI